MFWATLCALLIASYPALNGSLSLTPTWQYSADQLSIAGDVFIAVGSAMVGAPAIAFSLIMFALQTNIERMPHSRFFQFSFDVKLLVLFGTAVFLSLVVASSPLWILFIVSHVLATDVVICSTVLAVACIYAAYARSLLLVNPIRQLQAILCDVRGAFSRWSHLAELASPLLQPKQQRCDEGDTSADLGRLTYFQLNSSWTTTGTNAVSHAISFAQRFTERRDY